MKNKTIIKLLKWAGAILLSVVMFCEPLEIQAAESQGYQDRGDYENQIVEEISISPRNINIKYTTISLSFNDGKAVCGASVTGYTANTKSVSIELSLYKYINSSWSYVTGWSGSASSYTYTMSKSKSVSKGTYKLVADYYAGSEHISKSLQKTY